MRLSRFVAVIGAAALFLSAFAQGTSPVSQSLAPNTAQTSAGDNATSPWKGGAILMKNASGKDEACNIIGYETVIGHPELSGTPFVVCSSELEEAIRVSDEKEKAARRAEFLQEKRHRCDNRTWIIRRCL